MDHRIALKPNTLLCLCNDRGEAIHCVIESEIGRGGSCIVYEASRVTETGDKTLYRVKEFYPYKLSISRNGDSRLIPSARDAEAFCRMRERFLSDFSRTNQLFYSDSNYSSLINQLDVFSQNGTSYILSAYSSRKTLAAYKPESLKECVTLVRQTAYVLGKIHQQGYLYLDIKPDNVLVADGYQKQVQLFDFDSLLPMQDIRKISEMSRGGVRLSYSRGFAPIELQTSKIRRLGPCTDVYSAGALMFWLLFGRTPGAPDCEMDAAYDFSEIQYDYSRCDDKLFRSFSEFFHHALAVYYTDRYQSMQDAAEKLQEIEKYADPVLPRIYSTRIAKPRIFYGREREMEKLDELLADPDYNCLFVTGMGGIGKSTFIRVLYVHYKGSIEAVISDDRDIEINTMRQDEEAEPGTRYFDKKLRKIRELVRGTFSVLVIDNFSGGIDDDLRALLSTELKVILLSREASSFQSGREMKLSAISDMDALRHIFEDNLGRPVAEEEQDGFARILRRIERHTLVLELIAKQIANSHITVSSAASLTDEHGFSAIAPEKVDYEKDSRQTSDTIGNIIGALFEANVLSAEKKVLMKTASLLGDDGMDISRFQQIMKLVSKDDLNELIKDGWLMLSGDVISMHRVIWEAVHRWEWMPEYVEAARQFLTFFYVEIRLESTRNNYPEKLRRCLAIAKGELPPELKDRQIFQKLAAHLDRQIKKCPEMGLIGNVFYERYARIGDDSPADMEKLSSLLMQSEDILRQCRRDPVMKADDVYHNLLYITLLNMPRYKEESILAGADDIFSDNSTGFALKNKASLLGEEGKGNPIAVMKLYAAAVLIHADNKRFEEAGKLLEQAEKVARKVRHPKVYALYYDLLSNYYDILLDGHYDAEAPGEKRLRDKLFDATEKTLHYSKQGFSYDCDHLYAKNILAKATILIRSCLGSDKEISALLDTAQKIIAENTSRYADVRLQYYLVCAWYFALVHDNVKLAGLFMKQAWELSDIIIPTELRKIEEVIIPCANIFLELQCYKESALLLCEGIDLCVKYPNTDSYARIKQDLCRYFWSVGIEARQFEMCREMMEFIEAGNEEIIDPKNRVVIPDKIRSIITDGMT